jgi:pimeloyl-ACP methyl ester carboxylesterase
MKKFIQRFSYLFLFWMLFVLMLDGCVQFRTATPQLEAYFHEKGIPAIVRNYTTHGRQLRYMEAGNDTTGGTILFIHGAPSSLSYFNAYLTDPRLLGRARLFAVDRAGYGYSGFGKPEPSIEKQARYIRPILDSLHKVKRPLVVVGTSYGTSVACRLAMDYPELVDGIVLVAPSLAPGEERIYGISYPIELPPIRWMVPRMLQSANTEKLNHRKHLEKMLPLWPKVRVPVIYLQGDKDDLIYTSNAAFAREKLVNVPSLEIIFIKDQGHLIAFSEKETIMASILQMLDMVSGKGPAVKAGQRVPCCPE